MMTKTLVTAAAVAALMAGAAHAGDKAKKAQPVAAATTSDVAAQEMSPDARASASPPSVYAAPGVATDASATGAPPNMDASAVVATNVVTNGPIADTPENRARYGAPMSNAGKRTNPAGN